MKILKGRWKVKRVLSMLLACTMLFSSVELPVFAAESPVEVTQQENASEQPEEPETEAPEQPEEETGTETPEQSKETETPGEQENPGEEAGNGQTENPNEEGDGERPENPGTEDDGEQPDEPGTPGENDQTDTNKVAVCLSGITMKDKEYDGEAAAYTGTPVLKDTDNREVSDAEISLSPSYAGTLADGSVYEKTESAPSQAGEYTLTFTLAGADADGYTLEESTYGFQITPREMTVYSPIVTIAIGAKLPAVSSLEYGTRGLLEGDALLTPPSFRYSPENVSTDTAGEYEIVPFGADAGNNYRITYESGTLQVREEKILHSGTVNNISWKIDDSYNLTIEGTGDYECTYVSNFFQGNSVPPWCEYSFWHATVRVTGMTSAAKMFAGSTVQTVDLEDFDTSNITDMSYMFASCRALETLDLRGLDTSNVTDMSDMFYGCDYLKTLNLSNWDTSNVSGMGDMFFACDDLETLNLSGWDTSNVTSMYCMFGGCGKLKTLEGLDGFNTSSLKNVAFMFAECHELESLDLSGWILVRSGPGACLTRIISGIFWMAVTA